MILAALFSGEVWWNYPGFELWKFFNLFVFLFVLIFLLRGPIRAALNGRAEEIKKELRTAAEERKRALEELAALEIRLSRLEGEVAAIIEKAQESAQAEVARVMRGMETEIAKLREQSSREIERALKSTQVELRQLVANESVRLAEELIRSEIDARGDRLIETNLQKMAGMVQ